MADQHRKRMPLRTRILVGATVAIIGAAALLFGPHSAFLSARNWLGVVAFNVGWEAPARLIFETLAARDHPPAMNNYGAMMFHGLGDSRRNRPRAVGLFTEAAHQGYAPAQYNLGRAMQLGRGIEKDEQQARQWFERAAAQDNLFGLMMVVDAIDNYQELGSIDRVQALLERAAAHGDLEPLFSLAQHTHHTCWEREAEHICRARKVGYLRQAAERGHLVSQAQLGSELSRGLDAVEGFQWSLRAAEAGQYHGMRATARNYRTGNGVQIDLEQAGYWADRVETYPRVPTPFVMPRGYDAIYIYRYRRAARMPVPRPIEERNARLGLPADYRPAPVPSDPAARQAAIEHHRSLRQRYEQELQDRVAALLGGHPAIADSLDPAAVRDVHVVRVTNGRTEPLVPVTERRDYDIYRRQYEVHRSTVVVRYAGDRDAVFVLLSADAVDWRLEPQNGGRPQAVFLASPEVPMIGGLPPSVPLEIKSRDLGDRGFMLPPRREREWDALVADLQARFPNATIYRHHHVQTTLVLIR